MILRDSCPHNVTAIALPWNSSFSEQGGGTVLTYDFLHNVAVSVSTYE
jgi:hypothetical protein